MHSAAWKVRASTVVAVCLVVLAGVLTDVRPTLAQEACPLPAGETPPADPRVTAQNVVEGNATLAQFAQAATAQFERRGSETLTAQQIAYSGCRLRLEGGPWRSGSTYIVTLTLDGRVFLHAKDMSLSAAKLNPVIYGAILRALGIDPHRPCHVQDRQGQGWRLVQCAQCPRRLRLCGCLCLGQLGAPDRAAHRIRSRRISSDRGRHRLRRPGRHGQ